MKEIVKNTIAKLTGDSTFDEMKAALRQECEKVSFEITDKDFIEMFSEIIVYFINN